MRKIILEFEEFFVLLHYDLSSYFCALWDSLRLRCAIKLANAKQQAYCKRYYVMEYEDANTGKKKLTVINNNDIKMLKRMNLMNKRATHLDIMRDCLYYTCLSANEELAALSVQERMNRKAKWLKGYEDARRSYYNIRMQRIQNKKRKYYESKRNKSN